MDQLLEPIVTLVHLRLRLFDLVRQSLKNYLFYLLFEPVGCALGVPLG